MSRPLIACSFCAAIVAVVLTLALTQAEAHDYNVWQLRQWEDGSGKVVRDDLVCILPAFDDRVPRAACRTRQ